MNNSFISQLKEAAEEGSREHFLPDFERRINQLKESLLQDARSGAKHSTVICRKEVAEYAQKHLGLTVEYLTASVYKISGWAENPQTSLTSK